MTCKACGGDHRGWEPCRKPSVNTVKTQEVLTQPSPVVLTSGDRHKPGYMAEYMRKWRANQKLKAG